MLLLLSFLSRYRLNSYIKSSLFTFKSSSSFCIFSQVVFFFLLFLVFQLLSDHILVCQLTIELITSCSSALDVEFSRNDHYIKLKLKSKFDLYVLHHSNINAMFYVVLIIVFYLLCLITE